LTLPLRRGLRELGSRLVALRVVADPYDVFFARRPQIDEALRLDADDGWRRLAAQIAEQKTAYLAARERRPEWVLGEATAVDDDNGDDALAGLPGSPGIAEGVVHVVMSSDDFGAFPKGAVLVARTTNPAWTPLFYSAAAVVTESGGPLSHGAVTAREMRIPAVMSVKGVLARLRNGARVRVDGGQGRVKLLK
jgi:pyruvate,water dikinase